MGSLIPAGVCGGAGGSDFPFHKILKGIDGFTVQDPCEHNVIFCVCQDVPPKARLMEQECIRRASLLLVSADLGAPPDLTPQSLHYLRWCEKSPSSQGQHSLQACFLLGEQVTTPPGGGAWTTRGKNWAIQVTALEQHRSLS